jgi:hypothetical protein
MNDDMTTNYSKRELDMKFQSIIDKVDENHNDTKEQITDLSKDQDSKHIQNSNILTEIKNELKETKVQVTFTNGKVKKLQSWQSAIIMSGSVVVFMGGIIVCLIVYIYQYQLNQQTDKISNLVQELQK